MKRNTQRGKEEDTEKIRGGGEGEKETERERERERDKLREEMSENLQLALFGFWI